MDYIDIFRGSGYGVQGDWWSPNLKHSEMFKHGPLSGKMSKSKISLEDYKKGIEKASDYHRKVEDKMIKYRPESFSTKAGGTKKKGGLERVTPSKKDLRKQIDLDFKNMSLDDFKSKYYEAVLPNQPSKLALRNTLKPLAMNPKRVLGELKPKHAKVLGKAALGQAAKFAGPLGVVYGMYDYLKGSPAGEGSQLNDYNTLVYTDGPLAKKKR